MPKFFSVKAFQRFPRVMELMRLSSEASTSTICTSLSFKLCQSAYSYIRSGIIKRRETSKAYKSSEWNGISKLFMKKSSQE